jgi:hypothetical protein
MRDGRQWKCQPQGSTSGNPSLPVNKSTPGLTYVCATTVEGYPKCWNVEDVANKKTLTVNGDNCHTSPQHRSIGVVAHAHTEVSNRLL